VDEHGVEGFPTLFRICTMGYGVQLGSNPTTSTEARGRQACPNIPQFAQ
jgi:hypothetical protein